MLFRSEPSRLEPLLERGQADGWAAVEECRPVRRLEDVDGDDVRHALVQEIERLDAHRRRSKQNACAGRRDRGCVRAG